MGSSLALVKGKAAICDFSTSFFLCATVAVADQRPRTGSWTILRLLLGMGPATSNLYTCKTSSL